MVYGAAFCAVSHKEELSRAAYADSKTLTEEKREQLFQQLQADSRMGWMVDSISAQTLSAKMLSKCAARQVGGPHIPSLSSSQQALSSRLLYFRPETGTA